ncbi:hypothetical protein FCV25MIE_25796 [Fagus crenata]
MEVESVTSGIAEEESFEVDDNINNIDNADFEGGSCGICMDVVIDRGVLDCCQHCKFDFMNWLHHAIPSSVFYALTTGLPSQTCARFARMNFN